MRFAFPALFAALQKNSLQRFAAGVVAGLRRQ